MPAKLHEVVDYLTGDSFQIDFEFLTKWTNRHANEAHWQKVLNLSALHFELFFLFALEHPWKGKLKENGEPDYEAYKKKKEADAKVKKPVK